MSDNDLENQEQRRWEFLRNAERFLENSGQGLGMADLEGRIIYANNTLLKLLGEEDNKNINEESIFEYYTPETAERIKEEILPQVKEKGQWIDELTLKSKQGDIIPTIQNFFLLKDNAGKPACFASVITSLKELHHKIKKTEEKFRSAFLNSPAAVSITTIDTGCFKDVNGSFLRELGYERKEVIGKTVSDINLWTDPSHREAFRKDLADKSEIINQEYQFRDKAGKSHWALTSAVVFDYEGTDHILTQTIDITDRKLKEDAIQENLETLAKAEHIGHTGSWKMDVNKNDITVSEGMRKLMGFGDNEIISLDAVLTRFEKEGQNRIREIHDLPKDKDDPVSVEYTLKMQGNMRDRHIKETISHDSHGNPNHIYGVMQDITDIVYRQLRLEGEKKKLEKMVKRDIQENLATLESIKILISPEFSHAKISESPVSMIKINIGDSWHVKNSDGYSFSDSCAKYLIADVRPDDKVCPYSDNEFLLFLIGAKKETAAMRAEGWRKGLEDLKVRYGKNAMKTKISLGVVACGGDGKTLDEIVFEADNTMV